MCSALSLVDSFLVSFDWLITFRPKVTITAGKKRGKTPRPASPLPEVSVSVRQPGMLTLSLICRFIFGNFWIKCFRCYINHTSFSTTLKLGNYHTFSIFCFRSRGHFPLMVFLNWRSNSQNISELLLQLLVSWNLLHFMRRCFQVAVL